MTHPALPSPVPRPSPFPVPCPPAERAGPDAPGCSADRASSRAPNLPDLPDALDVPEEVGRTLLRRRGLRTGAVAWEPASARTRFLVPSGSAEELPGLLEWLEWGGIGLDLTVLAAYDPREAAVWLRPPDRGCGVDLAGLVSAAATECHRVRLSHATQPFAFS